MATSNESKKKSSPKATQTKESSRSGLTDLKQPILAFTLIIALLASVFALYATYTATQAKEQTLADARLIAQQFSELQSSHKDLDNKVLAAQAQLQETQAQVFKRIATVENSIRNALKETLHQSNDWLILKARYYLQLAQINAYWSNNYEATESLLKQANELLSKIHDQRLFKIRQAIAQEITLVQTLPKPDITGILSQLDAAKNTLSDLPLTKVLIPNEKDKRQTEEEASSPAWRERLKNSVNLLERLVVIRRHDDSIKPMLSANQEALLRESIRLKLQEAQWAVLQHNQSVYESALEQSIKSIQAYFRTNAKETQALLNQLNQLKSINLVINKPQINDSLNLINELIESNQKETINSMKKGESS